MSANYDIDGVLVGRFMPHCHEPISENCWRLKKWFCVVIIIIVASFEFWPRPQYSIDDSQKATILQNRRLRRSLTRLQCTSHLNKNCQLSSKEWQGIVHNIWFGNSQLKTESVFQLAWSCESKFNRSFRVVALIPCGNTVSTSRLSNVASLNHSYYGGKEGMH